MIDRAEKIGPGITAHDDPRITRVGRVLRVLKLDEIPQLLNVLKGDMSVVGPRPELPAIVKTYSDKQKHVLDVRPGMTSPAQIVNHHEEDKLTSKEDVERNYRNYILPEKLKLDLQYIRDKDPFKDIKIFLRGMMNILFGSVKLRYIFESKRRMFFLFF